MHKPLRSYEVFPLSIFPAAHESLAIGETDRACIVMGVKDGGHSHSILVSHQFFEYLALNPLVNSQYSFY
jgi:hypothetical protein